MKSSSSVGSPKARLERVLIVSDRHALVGRQHAVRRIDAHAIERTHRGVLTDIRSTASHLVGSVSLGDGTGPDNGIGALDGRSLWRRERCVRVVFSRLIRIERKRECDVLRPRRLLGEDVAGP